MTKLVAAVSPLLDGGGIYGSVMHYTIFFALLSGALLAFLYFWSRGKLDMDESPKMEMMREDE